MLLTSIFLDVLQLFSLKGKEFEIVTNFKFKELPNVVKNASELLEALLKLILVHILTPFLNIYQFLRKLLIFHFHVHELGI